MPTILKFSLVFFILIQCNLLTNHDKVRKDAPAKKGPVADGCPNTNYPDWETSDYVLPYPVGKSYTIDLSNCSGSYHSQGRPDEFAIDFNMAIGTQITASRAGTVVFIEESAYDGHGPNNLVVVDHGDGTFAEYMHLTHNGAMVEKGSTVKKGDPIGLSGSTGLAGYPHLHFVVAGKNKWTWPYESVPVTFSNTVSNTRGLASGYTYPAYAY